MEDFLFETLGTTHRTTQSLPIVNGMMRHAEDIFQGQVRARIITHSVDKKYKPPPSDPIFIKDQFPLDFLVVSNACKRANSQNTGDALPPDKESKLIDASGKRVATQSANHWRKASTQGLLARYDMAHWDKMEDLLQYLPEEHRKRELAKEGQLISNPSNRCIARGVNTSILLR